MQLIFSKPNSIVFGSGVFVTQAEAEDFKVKTYSYVSKVGVVPVDDTKGHLLGVWESRGVAVFENGESAACLARGYSCQLTNR
jgi:hypothetical protein